MATKNPSKTSDLPNGYVSKGGADGWDSRDSNHTTPSYMVANPKAMHVRVHANREQFEPGKKITVATNKTKNFENFLDECTEKVKPPWGAARRLYTARGRRRIQSLDELEEGSIYVITGNEKFKRCNYREISENSRGRIPRRIKGFKKIDIDRIYTPVQHAHSEQLRRKSGRSYSLGQKFIGLFLKVHINGKTCPAAHVVSIRPQKRTTRVDILDQVADDMNIQPGSIKWVFRIHNEGYGGQQDFELIHEAEEFQSNDHILVVPAPQKPLFTIYQIHGKPDISVKTSPRSDYIGQPYSHHKQGKGRNHDKQGKDRNKSGETSLNKFKPLPSIGSSKQSESRSPFSNAGSQGGRRNNQKSRARQVDYDKDHNNGVYHAKKQNNSRGAQQVNETRDTRTEKPLDQMEAEIVTEERVDEDAGMQHNDEFGDDSFNQYDSNTPGGRNKDMRSSTPVGQNKDMRSSTPASRGESRRMRQQKENEAAVRIQAATKGYQTRKKFNAEKESLQRQKDERNQRQQEDNDRRRQEEEDEYRRREADAQQNSQQKGRDEDLAASKIQASFKGYKTRKDLKTKQQGQK